MTTYYSHIDGNLSITIVDNNITNEERINCKIIHEDHETGKITELEFSNIDDSKEIGGHPNVKHHSTPVKKDGKGIDAETNFFRTFLRDLALDNYADFNSKIPKERYDYLFIALGYHDPIYDTEEIRCITKQRYPIHEQVDGKMLYSKPVQPLRIDKYTLLTRLRYMLDNSYVYISQQKE